MPKTSKRLFIAIQLPDGIRQEFATVCNFYHHPHLRWVPAENLHITLHFIGQTAVNDIPAIKEKISAIVSAASSFTMKLDKLKVINKNRHPVMIWATLEENKQFTEVALQFQKNLPGDNSKNPVPHITIARIKRFRKIEIPDLPEMTGSSFTVRSIELMQSETGGGHPVYKITESFALGS